MSLWGLRKPLKASSRLSKPCEALECASKACIASLARITTNANRRSSSPVSGLPSYPDASRASSRDSPRLAKTLRLQHSKPLESAARIDASMNLHAGANQTSSDERLAKFILSRAPNDSGGRQRLLHG